MFNPDAVKRILLDGVRDQAGRSPTGKGLERDRHHHNRPFAAPDRRGSHAQAHVTERADDLAMGISWGVLGAPEGRWQAPMAPWEPADKVDYSRKRGIVRVW